MRRLADRIIKRVFDDYVIKPLRGDLLFSSIPSLDFDLLFADSKRDAEIMLAKRLEEIEEAARRNNEQSMQG